MLLTEDRHELVTARFVVFFSEHQGNIQYLRK